MTPAEDPKQGMCRLAGDVAITVTEHEERRGSFRQSSLFGLSAFTERSVYIIHQPGNSPEFNR
jgi:hypothetical protein